jgi:hypothetical protein
MNDPLESAVRSKLAHARLVIRIVYKLKVIRTQDACVSKLPRGRTSRGKGPGKVGGVEITTTDIPLNVENLRFTELAGINVVARGESLQFVLRLPKPHADEKS